MSESALPISTQLFGILLVLIGGFGSVGDAPALGWLIWVGLLFGLVGLFWTAGRSLG